MTETDPHYVDVAVQRWEKWSGEAARHLKTGLSFELEERRKEAPQDAPTEGTSAPDDARVRHRTRAAS